MTVGWCVGDGGKHVAERRAIAGERTTGECCLREPRTASLRFFLETTKKPQILGKRRSTPVREGWSRLWLVLAATHEIRNGGPALGFDGAGLFGFGD
jgi:hypothetical protein